MGNTAAQLDCSVPVTNSLIHNSGLESLYAKYQMYDFVISI